MKRFFAVILTVAFLCIFLASCGEEKSKYEDDYVYDGTSLIGTWQESDQNDEYYQTYTFTKDKITLSSYTFGIKMQELIATYKVEGDNTLVVEWGNDGYVDRNKFSINKDSTLVIAQVYDSETNEMELVPYNLDWNKSNSDIVGSWVSKDYEGEVFTFKSGYTLLVEGFTDTYTMEYAIKGDTIAFGGEFVDGFKEEVTVMTYKVEGDTLTLTGQNEDESIIILTFEREK
jgi:hypothetical protein